MHTPKHAHWHILGAGAIGTLIAFKLSQQKRNFTLMGRNGNSVARDFTDLHSVRHHLIGAERKPIEYLLICTKSTQALAAFTTIQSRLNPQSVVVCLFNGLGAQQQIREHAICPVYFATTTEGVSKIAQHHYAYKGAGKTYIDALITQEFTQDKPPLLFKPVDNIDERLMDKLVINSLINPLTVLFDCKNGELLSNPKAMASMRALAGEIALWLSTYVRSVSADAVLNMAVVVAQKTANNTSSMRQDIQQKKVSEIDFINGYWLSNNPGKLLLPENARVVADVKRIEAGFV